MNGPAVELGRLGVWGHLDSMPASELGDYAARVEALGFGTLWVPETVGREPIALLVAYPAARAVRAVPLALLFFNVGVELGQLLFIAAVFGFAWLVRLSALRIPAFWPRVVAYAVGSGVVLLVLALGGRRLFDRVRRAGRGLALQRATGVVLGR